MKKIPEFQRLRERLSGGGFLIHASAANGDDRTLCGYAYEGSCTGGGDAGVHEVTRGKINCRSCLQIIWFCKGIKSTWTIVP